MKGSTLTLVSDLKSKLLEFPRLVSSLENKDIHFMDKLVVWIKNSEELLTTYAISEVSELSGLRSKLISSRFSDTKNSSIKKIQLKVAAEILYDLQHTLLNVLKPIELKTEECRELTRQLLQIVSQTKAIHYNHDLPFENLVQDVWFFIISNDQLKPGAVKLKTHLILTDIYRLIAEEINPDDFEEKTTSKMKEAHC
jgi:hypothetical protein